MSEVEALSADLGPLRPLIGTWEGERGIDDSYVYASSREVQARFRERATFAPAGPVHNGAMSCYWLDYRLTAWRLEESAPFHVEIGYWFWDAEHETVMRGLVTPRGIVVLAGGSASTNDRTITVTADATSDTYGILSNPDLMKSARTTRFEMTLDFSESDRYSYDQKTYMYQPRMDSLYCHRDSNTLALVSRAPGDWRD
jgi:hypothetical protein